MLMIKRCIHDRKMYDLTTAVRKLLALDTLNEDRGKNFISLTRS